MEAAGRGVNLAAGPSPRHAALDPAKVGMACFLVSEAVFFSTLIVVYLTYLNRTRPVAADVLGLGLPLLMSACLLSSSVTAHVGHRALAAGRRGTFAGWWAVTAGLGALFLAGTAHEWYGLIVGKGQTIGRGLFGTTYFTLVGFHAAHVTLGVVLLLTAVGLTLRGAVSDRQAVGVELVSWYWHFVDGVWVVVFCVVYLVGR